MLTTPRAAPVAGSRPRSTLASMPRPRSVRLTAGQAQDGPAALVLLDRLDLHPSFWADHAYNADGIRNLIEAQGAVPNIRAKSNRKWNPLFQHSTLRECTLVEHFFSKLRNVRRFATSYTSSPRISLAMVPLASVRLWLRILCVYADSTYASSQVVVATSISFEVAGKFADHAGFVVHPT